MSSSFAKRCVCGALIVTVTVSGLVFVHDPHTHTDRPQEPTARTAVAPSTTSVPGGPIFGDSFRIIGT